jgi:hypothetical protein
MFITGKQKFSGIYDLIWNEDEAEKLRKEEAKAKRAEAKAKKRKAREAENARATDVSRGRKMDRRHKRINKRIKTKDDLEHRRYEEIIDRPGGQQQPEGRKR